MDLLRAGRAINYADARDDAHHRYGRGRSTGRMIVRSYFLLLLALLITLGPASLRFAAVTECGLLLLAHDHVLLGDANEDDLRKHLQAEVETACAAGKSMAAGHHAPRTSARKEVVSVVNVKPISFPHMISVEQPSLIQTAMTMLSCSNRLHSRWASQSPTKAYSLIAPPLDPPPNPA